MPKGYLLLLLHAHLPYVRHPEHEYFLEENWLYETLIETYIPLAGLLERLIDDGVDFRLSLSLSPTLLAMFDDPLLRERFMGYLDRTSELTEREISRTKNDSRIRPLAEMYNENLNRIRRLYVERYGSDLSSAFLRLADTGNVELITTSATHAYLPNLSVMPDAVRTQIATACRDYERRLLRPPRGMWLPECGYYEGLDSMLKESGIEYFFLESHGLLHASPAPKYGVFMPVRSASGAAVFARDKASAMQVWSSKAGYPGDPDYREFYRDIGFDLPLKYIRPYIHPDGIRIPTGIKYHRITGRGAGKRPYERGKAVKKAKLHAEDFIRKKQAEAGRLNESYGFSPVLTAPYDAELFGHWWFEGIDWLEFLLRGLDAQDEIKTITPSEYLADNPALQTVSPSASSWGKGGYGSTWCSERNNWAIRHLHAASERMKGLSLRFPEAKDPLLKKALNQALRELLLMEASDWPFMIERRTSPHYAEDRLIGHINNFNRLYGMLTGGAMDSGLVSEMERKTRLFPFLDYRDYGRSFSKG
ncbi:MAG: DUF1957 domain-containing protein [Thermodesulfovibrionales bacterium]|nr:DUF1957 domain-containing protein [Thermodesulfovibrionales bacterium]